MPVRALTDAASVYAAARFIANAYDESSPQGMSYRSRSYDEALYYELMNNLILYDYLVYDNSSLESATADEIIPLFRKINSEFGEDIMAVESIGIGSDYGEHFIIHGLCQHLHDLVETDPSKLGRLEAVQVPWAYKSTTHVDFPKFEGLLRGSGLESLVPFAVFAWRGLCYLGVAETRHRRRDEAFAYVAAPGRIKALQAILSAEEMRDIRYPREAWNRLSKAIDEFPKRGLEFRNISSISPVYTSRLSHELLKIPQENHLSYIAERRNTRERISAREEWGELLFNRANSCTVGNQTIQIMRDLTVYGDVKQIATAAE
ncbi:MAG: hypothetical protein ACJ8FS_01645 [Sphingomicrobium sp.]